MKMTVTLNKEEVLAAVNAYVVEQTGKKVVNSDIEVGMDYEDRPGGTSFPAFKKAIVEVE